MAVMAQIQWHFVVEVLASTIESRAPLEPTRVAPALDYAWMRSK